MALKHKALVAQEVAAAIEKGSLDWRKPWRPVLNHGISSSAYLGSNAAITEVFRIMRGYKSHTWLTFNRFLQLQKENPKIYMKAGSKSVPIFMWKQLEVLDKKTHKPVLDKDGNPVTEWKYLTHLVYNADCFENLDLPEENEVVLSTQEQKSAEEYEKMLLSTYEGCPAIVHDASDKAYYASRNHMIHVQAMSSFNSVAEYIGTLAHEMGHSTGPALKRKSFARYNEEKSEHCYEELVAELTSCIVCAELGISDRISDNNAAYMKGWAQPLRDNPSWFIDAWNEAEKAASMIMGRLRKSEQQAA